MISGHSSTSFSLPKMMQENEDEENVYTKMFEKLYLLKNHI